MVMRFLIFVLLLLPASVIVAQPDSMQQCKLLLVFDTPGKVPHLSYIEGSLKTLVYSGGDQQQVFCDVKNLNAMRENLETEADLSRFLDFINPELDLYKQNSKSRQQRDSVTVKLLTGFGQLMKVTVTPESGALLYSFQLYHVLSPPGELPVLDPYNSSEQLINPKDQLATKQLMLCIKNVCKVSNAPPQVRLIPVNAVQQIGFYAIAVDDTLVIDPEIKDPDSPSDNIMCRWYCKPVGKSVPLRYTQVSPTFHASTNDSGTYLVWTKVSDRINEVYSDTLRIVFVFRPEIVDLPGASQLRTESKYESKTIYQSYVHFGTEKPLTIHKKTYKLNLRRNSPGIQFGFDAPWMPDSEEKDQLNKAFKITSDGQSYLIEHQAKNKNAGSYRFFVTAYDRGIASKPGIFIAKYYKAWPVYFTIGTSRNKILNYKDASLQYFTFGFTGYMKHRILIDFKAEVPLPDTAILQQAHTYPRNWRSGITYELFPNQKSFFAGAEFSLLYLYYPWNTRQGYIGYALGLHLKVRYMAKHWAMYFRPQIGYLEDFPQKGSNNIYLSTQFGFAFQPVVKGKIYR